jgi:hypothetical protein
MTGICPVCNGLARLEAACPACGHRLDDAGRLYDYYGDYSPYRPIDDAKLTNGFPDLAHRLCVHVGWCPACRQEHLLLVRERTNGPFPSSPSSYGTADAAESPRNG